MNRSGFRSGRKAPSRARIGDLETHVIGRLVTVCHVWPGITPLNVWELTLDVWLMFAAAADDWAEQQKKEA